MYVPFELAESSFWTGTLNLLSSIRWPRKERDADIYNCARLTVTVLEDL